MPVRPVLAAAVAATLASHAARADTPVCQGTVSGAVTGAFACLVEVASGGEGTLFFVITPKDPIDGVPTYQPGSFELPPPVTAKTYTLDTLGVGMASVAAEGGALYTATKTSSQRGEVTLALGSVQPDPARRGAFAVHGSYRARLVPVGAGKKGEVVVEVRF